MQHCWVTAQTLCLLQKRLKLRPRKTGDEDPALVLWGLVAKRIAKLNVPSAPRTSTENFEPSWHSKPHRSREQSSSELLSIVVVNPMDMDPTY